MEAAFISLSIIETGGKGTYLFQHILILFYFIAENIFISTACLLFSGRHRTLLFLSMLSFSVTWQSSLYVCSKVFVF